MIYTGLPNRMLVDQGRYFGDTFATLGALSNVDVKDTGVEAHNSLGLGERYHQPLMQTYRKIMSEHPQSPPERALAAAVKAMNDTLGPEGFVPVAKGRVGVILTRNYGTDPIAVPLLAKFRDGICATCCTKQQ